jgi:curli production assembly/transport component CsgF
MGTEMKTTLNFKACFFGALFFNVSIASASELIYTPVNPAFGGFPGNGSVLLNNANAQNDFKDPDAYDPYSALEDLNQDPLANFQESLNRQVLSLIANKIVQEAFGTDTGIGDGGSYTYEYFEITITPGTDAISVTITDTQTGETTDISVPIFTTTTTN